MPYFVIQMSTGILDLNADIIRHISGCEGIF